jgi:hypothetical protein
MSNQKDRVNTIVALINSCPAFGGSMTNKIKREFHQVVDVEKVSPTHRKNILKVLHSTRALDTALKTFLDYHAISNGSYSIGSHLYQLNRHTKRFLGKISDSERVKFQRTIVDIRNTYLHQADSYPRNDSEVLAVISEMHSLMTRITAL